MIAIYHVLLLFIFWVLDFLYLGLELISMIQDVS